MTGTETFTTALQNLATHKLRTALTMLGMIFGVGAVIAMLSRKRRSDSLVRLARVVGLESPTYVNKPT